MKKSIKLIAPLAAVLLLAGCGGKPTPNPDNPDKPDVPDVPIEPSGDYFVQEDTTIILSTTAGKESQVALNRYIDSFKKIEPKVTVKLDVIGGSYSDAAKQTIDGFAAGKHGDMVMVYPDAVADFIDYGFAYNLEPYMTNEKYGWTEEDFKDIKPAFLKEGQTYTIPGTYSLPMSKSTEMMFYDAEKFLGITFEGVNGGQPVDKNYMNNLTWEELFDNLCPAIIKYADAHPGYLDKTAHEKGWGILGYDSDPNLFITLAQQYGYEYTGIENGKGIIKFNNDGMKGLIKKFAGYAQDHYIMTAGSINERPNNIFTKDGCLLSIGSTGGIKYQYSDANPKKLEVAPIPTKEGGEKSVIMQGPSMAFLKHKDASNKPDKNRMLASWLFYKHMTNVENALDWALSANYMPIRQSGYDSDIYKEISDPSTVENPKSFDALIARVNKLLPSLADGYYSSPAFKGSNAARDNVDKLVSAAFKIDPTKNEEQRNAEIDKLFKKAYEDTLLKC